MMRTARTAVIAASVAVFSGGCASLSHQFRQLPFEVRVLHVETNRATLPREVFTGPLPSIVTSKALPADPWTEAFKVIAQAISDVAKHIMRAEEYKASAEIRHSFFSWDLVLIRWGSPKEPEQSAQMWDMYSKFLDKLPTEIPMYHPNVEDFARAMQAFQGWRDEPRGK